jgi:RNA polymerase sigma-70 factor (ECF subfamily)
MPEYSVLQIYVYTPAMTLTDNTTDNILELSDEQIAITVQKGDAAAFGALVERYQPKLLRYAQKFLFAHEDAQDMVQEVFIKAYANIKSFQSDRIFSSWVYRIAHNEFINAIKKKGREPISFFDPDTIFPHPVAADMADSNLHRQEIKHMVDSCLDKLDPKYREPLVLYFYEEMDYRAISGVMRIPVSTVGVRIKRAKEALQKIYKSSL